VHHRFRTPYIAIILFCLVSLLLLTRGFSSTKFFTDLGSLYVFGSLLTFALAHVSILALRARRPDLPRPFKLGGNIKIKGREMPITAILGLITTMAVWVVVIVVQPYSRWAGIIWMIIGLTIYYLYRRKRRMSLTHPGSEPAKPDSRFLIKKA
jgi:APA family basic amino acid/polyamine antiporter